MFDAHLRKLIDPPLDRIAEHFVSRAISANAVTITAFSFGLLAMLAISFGWFIAGLALLLLNRLGDGLDGAIARRSEITDFGGYLDIVLDFIIYAGIVFAFALHDPSENGLAAAFLLFSFMGTGCSFLAFAILAGKRGISTEIRGKKSFYYLGGLTEGAETIAVLIAFCLWPSVFNPLAWIFGTLCWITTVTRIAAARSTFN